ncbi:Protein of unknown function (DUF2892) [Maribacter polysiphoniae]|nr:Protein of unknown function (DUF2892) [Maribacter polysiphoniae]
MGGIDKMVRVILALIAGLLVYFGVVDGTISYILLALASVFVLTSLVGFCPLYGIFGVDTCHRKK